MGKWSTIAPAMMQHIMAGPGVAPAKHMAEHSEKLLSFSKATTVVDMGCGPGQVTNGVLEAHSAQLPASAKIIGADNNAQMIGQFTRRREGEIAKGNSAWERTETVEVDVHDCSKAFADGSVSHMLCGFVIFLVPEPAKAIASMQRALAPGGVLAMSSLKSSEWVKLSTYPLRVRPDLKMSGPNNGCSSAEEVTNQLQTSGFKNIEVIEIESYMAFDDYDTVCRFLLTKLPMAARAISQMTNEEVLKTHAMMVADLKTWHPELPAKMIGRVNVAYATK
ncbi:hypothetical protein KJ359_003967 [Pestalotiopsis sp. 9143b]|nr:hypothetical protein KJ359_003967 [Pestalotiopsis sp. 9143b]